MSLSGHKGFTLLEILAAIAVLGIVLTALFRLHLQTLSMGTDARFYAAAPLLAQEKIARIETEGLEQVRFDSGDFDAEYSRYRWEAQVAETDSVEFEKAAALLRRIEVNIVDQQNQRTFTLRTYRYVK